MGDFLHSGSICIISTWNYSCLWNVKCTFSNFSNDIFPPIFSMCSCESSLIFSEWEKEITQFYSHILIFPQIRKRISWVQILSLTKSLRYDTIEYCEITFFILPLVLHIIPSLFHRYSCQSSFSKTYVLSFFLLISVNEWVK